MTTKTYAELKNLKKKKNSVQFAPYTGLSRTRPGVNWDTPKISAI